jgi:hypothetical protein
MINFRFHLVSLVAVFLALAIGVVMGYGVLGQPTVEGLQSRIDRVEANAEARREENDQLTEEVDRLDRVIDATSPFALTDRLLDVPITFVAVRGIDGDTVKRLVELARLAGGETPMILWVEEKLALANDTDAEALATALGASDTKKLILRDMAWETIANRLVSGPDADDPLRALVDGGFLTLEGLDDGVDRPLATIGGRASRVVLVTGTDAVLTPKMTVDPFARAALDASLPLVVAEAYRELDRGVARGALLSVARDDEAVANRISTVDNLDRPSGDVVTLLALADLGRGVVGHYGLGEGASAPVPAWWQP